MQNLLIKEVITKSTQILSIECYDDSSYSTYGSMNLKIYLLDILKLHASELVIGSFWK